MARMMTVPAQILALTAILGVMPTRKADDAETFYFRDGDRYIHATVCPDFRGKTRFYIGAYDKERDSYITGQLPLDADLSSLSMGNPYGTLQRLMTRHPWDDRKGDFV